MHKGEGTQDCIICYLMEQQDVCPFTGQQAFLRALIKYMDLLF